MDREPNHGHCHECGISHAHNHVHENEKAVVNRLARAIGHLEKVKRMVEEGHTVANHTYHHKDMSAISDKAAFEKEIVDLEVLYEEITGQKMTKFYRPPQGSYCEENLKMAKELGYRTFFWSLAYVDWYEEKQPTKEEAFDKLLNRIHPGAIVLLHSTSRTNGEIMDELLSKWEEMGYRFAPLTELFQ